MGKLTKVVQSWQKREVHSLSSGYTAFGARPNPNGSGISHPLNADAVCAAARAAQRSFVDWPEERVDSLLLHLAAALSEQAADLADMAVCETEIGNSTDKRAKIRFSAVDVVTSLVGRSGVGICGEDSARGVTEVAAPIGVILAMVPVTNPVSTLVHNVLIGLKARNAMLIRAHRAATESCRQAVEIVRSILAEQGADADLVQVLPAGIAGRSTNELLTHPGVDLILATGGSRLLSAVQRAGKPAITVGAGNVPAWIRSDADLPAAAEQVVSSKSFDHGVICGSESTLVVDQAVRDPVLEALRGCGAVIVNDGASRFRLQNLVLDHRGNVHRPWVGKSAAVIANEAGIAHDGDPRVLLVPIAADQIEGPWTAEKLAPILAFVSAKTREGAVQACQRVLDRGGAGHTMIVHTADASDLPGLAARMPASRLLVNSSGSLGCIGASTGLTPSLTLACGPAGGSTITDNITFTHLRQVRRIAHNR